jgi:DNA-binding response OmpR family regulator
MESILMIHDDVDLCSVLRDYFVRANMNVAISHQDVRGLEEARNDRFDLVLVEVMLPGNEVIDVLRRLRANSDMRIFLLTARSEIDGSIQRLENGAGGHQNKQPFQPKELDARIRALQQEKKVPRPQALPHKRAGKLSIYGFEIDPVRRTAQYLGVLLALTETEVALLEALLESPGVVLPREKLFRRVFGRPYHPMDRGLDMLVSRLRRKLDIEDNPGAAIRTIRSAGYVFCVPGRKFSRSVLS